MRGFHAEPVTEHIDVVADPRSGDWRRRPRPLLGVALSVRSGGEVGKQRGFGVVGLAFGDRGAVVAGPDRAEQGQPRQVAGRRRTRRSGRRLRVGSASFDGLPEPGAHRGGEGGKIFGGQSRGAEIVVIFPGQHRCGGFGGRVGSGAAGTGCVRCGGLRLRRRRRASSSASTPLWYGHISAIGCALGDEGGAAESLVGVFSPTGSSGSRLSEGTPSRP